jgi:hypothetical protein
MDVEPGSGPRASGEGGEHMAEVDFEPTHFKATGLVCTRALGPNTSARGVWWGWGDWVVEPAQKHLVVEREGGSGGHIRGRFLTNALREVGFALKTSGYTSPKILEKGVKVG